MVIHKETMRTANERSVLQRIFTESPISKSQIARDVKLNKVTVSQIVNRFIESGLVVEAGAGDSTQQGGRSLTYCKSTPGTVTWFALTSDIMNYQRWQ